MRSALMISLGAQLALGYFTNSSEPLQNKLDVHPLLIGDFRLFGCVASTAGFPNFKKVASTNLMNLDFCAASCPGKFFGTFNRDCYCGDELDFETAGKVDENLCNTPCPGDEHQTCGGLAAARRLALEKQEPRSVVLSLYVRIHGEEHHDDHEYQHDDHEYKHDDHEYHHNETEYHHDDHEYHNDGHQWNNTYGTKPTRPYHTFTSTITSTKTSTITSCPSWVEHCPVGHKTTEVVTVTTELCPKPEWHKKKIVCYGGHCAPEEPCREEHCEHHRVICSGDDCYPEVCTDKDEWHKLVICDGKDCRYHQCSGEECNSKIVCYDGKCAKETCYGEECHKKFVCKDSECGHEHCNGDDCHKYEVCNGSGADCKPCPPCNGASCPVPPPPAPRPQPPAPTHDHPSPPNPPVHPTTAHGWPHPTQPPVVAGSTKLGATVLTALLSFVFFL
ncbi:hypothetical protein Trihar35433_3328 [Trichoderma harzianum]|nr:hypothetical protein Trihar35433_3328 [Trichoderma harzianum]